MAGKTVLGRGLGSLFPPIQPAQTSGTTGTGATQAGIPTPTLNAPIYQQQSTDSSRDRHPGISLASIQEIIANPYQPRRDFDESALEELAASIKASGIIQPLVVRKSSQGYELIAGERRLRAAKKAGLTQVPIVIRKSTDRESLEIALVENIQRQDLNCIDEALAYQQLMEDFALTQEEVATRVGKERATVANCLRLLKLPSEIVAELKGGNLSFGHGKAILSLEDQAARIALKNEILANKLSVRSAESRAQEIKNGGKAATQESQGNKAAPAEPKKSTPLTQRLDNLSRELSRTWSAKVEISGSDQKGKISIHYSNRQELDRILSAMQNEKTWQTS
ncbi:MAG: ParB/RepB/Spo0J family partition protein [Bdellovibrionales bacterium]|nr:ParB/RepB/Spo0J family partition protein [Bdellovibrionales bacterium]